MSAQSHENIRANWIEVVMHPVRVAIVGALIELGEATAAELAAHSHTSNPTLREHLATLAALGVVRERRGASDGFTPGRPATRYFLTADVEEAAVNLFAMLSTPIETSPRRTSWRQPGR